MKKGKEKKEEKALPLPPVVGSDDSVNGQDAVIEYNPEVVHRIIKKLPEKDQRIISAIITESRFSGPIPPPELLMGYKSVLPDAPERIITMAEKEQGHRHQIETRLADRHVDSDKKGQIFGFILVLFFGVCGFVLGIYGHEDLARIIVTTTIIGVGIIFVLHQIPSFFSKPSPKGDKEAE